VDPALKRYAWPALAAAALGYLLVLGLTGERPGPGLAPFEARGPLRDTPLASISAVELAADGRAWRFERTDAGVWRVAQGPPLSGLARDLPTALTLLRNSGPARTLPMRELSPANLAEFGLDAPRLRVAVHAGSAQTFVIAFGGANALATDRYARVAGREEVMLLPAFVAEAWERLAGMP
jgi:hypothetical protein